MYALNSSSETVSGGEKEVIRHEFSVQRLINEFIVGSPFSPPINSLPSELKFTRYHDFNRDMREIKSLLTGPHIRH